MLLYPCEPYELIMLVWPALELDWIRTLPFILVARLLRRLWPIFIDVVGLLSLSGVAVLCCTIMLAWLWRSYCLTCESRPKIDPRELGIPKISQLVVVKLGAVYCVWKNVSHAKFGDGCLTGWTDFHSFFVKHSDATLRTNFSFTVLRNTIASKSLSQCTWITLEW